MKRRRAAQEKRHSGNRAFLGKQRVDRSGDGILFRFRQAADGLKLLLKLRNRPALGLAFADSEQFLDADFPAGDRRPALIALIQSRGVSLRQQGTNWTGLCPFHDDTKTPNLIATPGKGLFRCMASGCGAPGNAIQFVQRFDGVSFCHAFELLANGGKAAFEHAPEKPKGSRLTVPRLPCPLEDSAEAGKLLEQVANY